MDVTEALAIRLSGDMTKARLDRFRDLLSLKKRGRLDDEEDWEFGVRHLNRQGGHFAEVVLYRYPDRTWRIVLSYRGEPPADDLVEQCRSEVAAAALQVGLTVDYSWTPSGGQRSDN